MDTEVCHNNIELDLKKKTTNYGKAHATCAPMFGDRRQINGFSTFWQSQSMTSWVALSFTDSLTMFLKNLQFLNKKIITNLKKILEFFNTPCLHIHWHQTIENSCPIETIRNSESELLIKYVMLVAVHPWMWSCRLWICKSALLTAKTLLHPSHTTYIRQCIHLERKWDTKILKTYIVFNSAKTLFDPLHTAYIRQCVNTELMYLNLLPIIWMCIWSILKLDNEITRTSRNSHAINLI